MIESVYRPDDESHDEYLIWQPKSNQNRVITLYKQGLV